MEVGLIPKIFILMLCSNKLREKKSEGFLAKYKVQSIFLLFLLGSTQCFPNDLLEKQQKNVSEIKW